MEISRRLTGALSIVGALIAITGCGCNGAAPTPTDGTNPAPNNNGSGTTAARPVAPTDGNTVEGDVIKIGLIGSMTGSEKPWGDDEQKGAQIAVKEINDAGGINGKKVELVVGDSAGKPEQGKSAAEKLISSDKVIGIVGEVASGITMQIQNAAFDKGIPVVAVGATRTDLTDGGNNIFRVCYTDAFQGPAMASFAYNDLKLRNIAIVTDKQLPYSTGLSDSFRKKYEELGGKIVDEQFYEKGQNEFKGQLTQIKAKNPDGLFLSGYFTEVGPLVRQAHDLGINAKFLGGDGWDSREIVNLGGDAIIGAYFANHYSSKEDRPQVKDFLAKWGKAYGGVPGTTMGALGYDATMVTLNALKNCKTLNSKSLIEAIENTENYQGVSGNISLKGMGGSPHKRVLVVQITKDGTVAAKSVEWTDVMGSK